jgi:hypothetical protein
MPRNQENRRAWYRRNYESRRLQAITYLGGCCVDCGYDANPDGLEFDHLLEHGKPDRPMMHMTRSWETLAVELKKCQPVCATCHAIRTRRRIREGIHLA